MSGWSLPWYQLTLTLLKMYGISWSKHSFPRGSAAEYRYQVIMLWLWKFTKTLIKENFAQQQTTILDVTEEHEFGAETGSGPRSYGTLPSCHSNFI